MSDLVSDDPREPGLKAHALASFNHASFDCKGTVIGSAEYTDGEGLRYRVGCDSCDAQLVVRHDPALRLQQYERVAAPGKPLRDLRE